MDRAVRTRRGSLSALVAVGAVVGMVLGMAWMARGRDPHGTLVAVPAPPAPRAAVITASRSVVVPPGHPMVELPGPGEEHLVLRRGQPMGKVDVAGVEHRIACMTCHTGRTPDPRNAGGADLDLFHQGLVVRHGANTCLSCHNANDYGTLRLASGEAVAFDQSPRLCGQCHGPQFKDFLHGAHGGMNGYWDLSAGGRLRQACTSCHDPHAPAYPQVMPMPHARDRFQTPADGEHP